MSDPFGVPPPPPPSPPPQPPGPSLLVNTTISKDRSNLRDEADRLDFSSSIGKPRFMALKSNNPGVLPPPPPPPPPLPPPPAASAARDPRKLELIHAEQTYQKRKVRKDERSSPGPQPAEKETKKRKFEEEPQFGRKGRSCKRCRAKIREDDQSDTVTTESEEETEDEKEIEDKEEAKEPPPVHYRVLHRVACASDIAHNNTATLYEDIPEINTDPASLKFRHLFGKIPVRSFDPLLLDKRVGFVVFRYHSCPGFQDRPGIFGRRTQSKSASSGVSFQETILIYNELHSAILQVATYESDPSNLLTRQPDVLVGKYYLGEEYSPYPHLYNHLDAIRDLQNSESLSENCRAQVRALCEYLDEEYGDLYNELRDHAAHGRVKRDYLEMFFRPNEVILSKKNGVYTGWVLRSLPVGGNSLTLYCWNWKHDGRRMIRHEKEMPMSRPAQDVVDIISLGFYPLRYASLELLEELESRGQKFWNYRKPSYVSYKGPLFENEGGGMFTSYSGPGYDIETRFMIDYATYQRLHPQFDPPAIEVRFDPWPMRLDADEEPDAKHYILMPPNVHAFDIKEKEWKNLHIEHIGPITWNKRAFQRLVLPKRTKDLVQALVMVRRGKSNTRETLRLAGDRNDIITGKGNGLILLLHGGPGTGKTLTAESVAELAEMPLYSVTCGDIGTTADMVEKYLQTILYLGKTWNCVLLLDEADIFLEERTLSDLERNSLVSVFLRTLEYYEGILVLTSNRVGTFDEAFKSRIQVALHYPSLDTPSRRKIWQNFFDMLTEDESMDVDTEDLVSHLDELAEHEMNGRQIRNVLTTAWQTALYKKQRMQWEHLEQSLMTADQFNGYLRKLQGVSDQDRARDEKVRW